MNRIKHRCSKCSVRSPRAPRAIRLLQWFSTFLVERNPNETFQRLEEPLCGNLIVLCQGGPTSALSWAACRFPASQEDKYRDKINKFSKLFKFAGRNRLETPIFVPKSRCSLEKKKKVFT